MDEFLDELSLDQYLEWMAFDVIEPLNIADLVMMRMFGTRGRAPGGTSWQAQKAKLLQHISMIKGLNAGK